MGIGFSVGLTQTLKKLGLVLVILCVYYVTYPTLLSIGLTPDKQEEERLAIGTLNWRDC